MSSGDRPARSGKRAALAICAILVATAGLALWGLDRGPNPLTVDEGYNGVDALRPLAIFYAANNGREPLYVWLAALSTRLLGPSMWSLRLPAAFATVARVAATYGVVAVVLVDGRGRDRRPVATLAALCGALSVWSLHLGRSAVRLGLLPVLISVVVALVWMGLRRAPDARSDVASRGWAALALAGIGTGVSLYTYLPARLLPLLVAAICLCVGLRWPRRIRAGLPGIAIGSLLALAVAAPLLGYFADHPAAASLRAGQVSLLNPQRNEGDIAGLLGRNIVGTVLMFGVRGDPSDLYNVAGQPVFSPVVAATLLVGVLVALRRWREPAYSLWVLWLVLFAAAGVFSDRSPHFARQVGVLPAAWALAGLGAWTVVSRLASSIGRPVALFAAAVFVTGLAMPLAEAFYDRPWLDAGSPAVTAVRAAPAGTIVALAAGEPEVTIVAFLTGIDERLRASHGFNSVAVATEGGGPATLLLERDWYSDEVRGRFGEWRVAAPRGGLPDDARFDVYDVGERLSAPGFQPTPRVTLAIGAELLDFALPRGAEPGDTVSLALHWRVLDTDSARARRADPSEDFTWFVHLIDDAHRVVSQADWLGYPTWQWQGGDEVLSWYSLPLGPDTPCEPLHVEVGAYSRASGRRVPLWVDADGAAAPRPDDRVVFGDLQVCP